MTEKWTQRWTQGREKRKSKRKKVILSGKCSKEIKKERKSKRLGRSWGNLLEGARLGSLGPNRPSNQKMTMMIAIMVSIKMKMTMRPVWKSCRCCRLSRRQGSAGRGSNPPGSRWSPWWWWGRGKVYRYRHGREWRQNRYCWRNILVCLRETF